MVVLGIPICLAIILLCFTGPLLKRLKQYRLQEYEVYRTRILSKDVYHSRGHRGIRLKVYYYCCQGIEEKVIPVSQKLYDMAKVNEPITVVRLKVQNAYSYVGITLGEDT